VEKSLVQVGDDSTDGRRYRLLETLKQYGLERLDEAGERFAPRRPGLVIG
jgi:predicted ATPase